MLEDLADDEPVAEHANRGQVLLDGRDRSPGWVRMNDRRGRDRRGPVVAVADVPSAPRVFDIPSTRRPSRLAPAPASSRRASDVQLVVGAKGPPLRGPALCVSLAHPRGSAAAPSGRRPAGGLASNRGRTHAFFQTAGVDEQAVAVLLPVDPLRQGTRWIAAWGRPHARQAATARRAACRRGSPPSRLVPSAVAASDGCG